MDNMAVAEDVECIEYWLNPSNADKLAALRQRYPELADLVDMIEDRIRTDMAARKAAAQQTIVMTIKQGELNGQRNEQDQSAT